MMKIQTIFDTIRRKLETLDDTIYILLLMGIEYCDTKQMQAKIRLFEIEEKEKQRRLDADRKYYVYKTYTNHKPLKCVLSPLITKDDPEYLNSIKIALRGFYAS